MFFYDESFYSISDEMKQVISPRNQGNLVFNFYINLEGKLHAECQRDGGLPKRALLIKGIPEEWQSNLHDPERLYVLQDMLEESYFCYQAGDVHVNSPVLGGWNKDVHLEKTEKWCKPYLGKDSRIVAKACMSVDSGETSPYNIQDSKSPKDKAQSWHFNCYKGKGGNREDSRVMHAAKCFKKALTNMSIQPK